MSAKWNLPPSRSTRNNKRSQTGIKTSQFETQKADAPNLELVNGRLGPEAHADRGKAARMGKRHAEKAVRSAQ
jgi:hypothetical protein